MTRRPSGAVVVPQVSAGSAGAAADHASADQADTFGSRLIAVATDLPRRALEWPALVPTVLAAALAIWYLASGYVGTDLAAQIARADFARSHPLTPVDLRWFSGTSAFSYSLWTPVVMAWAGVRLTGAICCVVATAQLTTLFARTGARRPILGGVAAAILQALNLMAGRVTFGVGTVCALAALLTLAPARSGESGRRAGWQTAIWGVATGGASPVAALFLWVCGGALVLHGRVRDGLVLIVASASVVLVAAAVFGSGGMEPFAFNDARDAFLATLAVVIVAPRCPALVRTGALIGLVMVVAAYLLPTAVGNNAARFSLLFAVPVVAAYAGRWLWVTLLAIAVTAYPQQMIQTKAASVSPDARASFYAPLLAQLDRQGPITGRLEVPETRAHWDAAYLARHVWLARGWLRQTDVARNGDLFFSRAPITDASYRRFLTANAVQFVAIPAVPLGVSGHAEVAFLSTTHRYLRQVWHSPDWTLFEVRAATPIVGEPARLVSHDAASLTVAAPADATVQIHLEWSRWLYVTGPAGGCLAPMGGDTVQLQVRASGRYTVASRLFPPDTDCP